MSAPSFWEIAFLALLALLIFGPDKLPGMARTAGRVIGQIRREASATLEELKQSADFAEIDEVRGELRSMGQELRQASDVRGALGEDPRPDAKGDARAAGGEAQRALPAARSGAAPFDPDAT